MSLGGHLIASVAGGAARGRSPLRNVRFVFYAAKLQK